MSLAGDISFMLNRSGESRLVVDRALRSIQKSIRRNGERMVYQTFSPEIRHNLCCSRILQGNFSDWTGWEYRDEWAEAMRNGISSIPFWTGEPVDRLVVIGEQGVGDEILWASILPEAMIRCKQVTYCCDERLVAPLARALPGLHTKTRYVDARDDLLDGYDAYIPAADLMCLFRLNARHFPRKPFLKPDPARLPEFEKYRDRVGVSWRGRHGSLNPSELGLNGAVNLQYDASNVWFDQPHIDLKNDIEGVITLCSVLSHVVCVPTSVWHFAAAVGTPTDVILPDAGTSPDKIEDQLDWHCPVGDSPFYSNSTVYANIKAWEHSEHVRSSRTRESVGARP